MTVGTAFRRLRRAVRRRADERGIFTLVSAMVMGGVLAAVGMTVDYAGYVDGRRRAQSASDAAAMAAVQSLDRGASVASATVAAQAITVTNGFPLTDLQLTFLTSDGFPTAIPDQVASVKAHIQTVQKTLFMGIVGVATTSPWAQAAANRAVAAAGTPCIICSLSSSATSMNLSGTGAITVTGGAIHSNGGLTTGGGATLSAPVIEASGIISGAGYSTPPVNTPLVRDPLATVPVPSWAGLPIFSGNNDIRDGKGPGVYTGNNVISQSVTLKPGVYVFAGNLSTSGQAKIVSSGGVFLYFTCRDGSGMPRACAAGESGASFSLAGGSGHAITPMTSGPYQGLTVMYDRNSTADLRATGNSTNVSGTIYAAAGSMTLAGSSITSVLDSRLVVGTLTSTGASNLRVTNSFTAANNYSAVSVASDAHLIE